MHRSPEHVIQFLFSELGTSGSVDGSKRLVIKGRFQQKQIENVLRRYIGTLFVKWCYDVGFLILTRRFAMKQSNTLHARHANLPTPNLQKTTVSSSSPATPVDPSSPSAASKSASRLKQREDRRRPKWDEWICGFLSMPCIVIHLLPLVLRLDWLSAMQ